MSQSGLSCSVGRSHTLTARYRYGDNYMMIGFSLGIFVVVSTHVNELGKVRSTRCTY